MFRFTNSISRLLTIAAFAGTVTLAVPSYAASGNDTIPPRAMEKLDKAVMADGVEKRISQLHGKLRISAAQESQWNVVAQAMRDNAKNMDALIKERSANAKTMTAMDDLRSYEKLAAAHEEGLKAFIPVFQLLYDTMSDDRSM